MLAANLDDRRACILASRNTRNLPFRAIAQRPFLLREPQLGRNVSNPLRVSLVCLAFASTER